MNRHERRAQATLQTKRQRLPSLLTPPDARAAAAIAHVRANIRSISDGKIMFFGVPLSWFDPADGRGLAITILKRIAADPVGLIDVCNLGRVGWVLAHEALCELIIEYQHGSKPMPPPLATYNEEIVLGAIDPARRHRFIGGPEKADHFLRDIAIVFLVGDVCWKFGFRPRRDAVYRRRLSGCAVVVLALSEEHMPICEEGAVENACRKYWRMAFPRGKFKPETYPFPNT